MNTKHLGYLEKFLVVNSVHPDTQGIVNDFASAFSNVFLPKNDSSADTDIYTNLPTLTTSRIFKNKRC